MRFSKLKIAFLIAGLVILAACGESNQGPGANRQFNKGNFGDFPKMNDATPVEVIEINRGQIGAYILLNATVETEQNIDIYSQAEGFVQEILHDEGAYVSKGDIILRLDARELQLKFERAQLDYEKSAKEYERYKNISNTDVFSKEEKERIEYQYHLSRIARDEVKLNLDYASIKSPINGYLSNRLIKLGDRINRGAKIYQITNTSEKIVNVQIPEKDIFRVKKGQSVKISSDNLADQNGKNIEVKGLVKRVSPVIDPSSGTFKTTITIENNQKVVPGMFVNVRIQTDLKQNSLLIPKSALVYENDQRYVFKVKDSLAVKMDVKPGYEDSYFIETLNDDITEKDKIVSLGQNGLKDQAKVKIVNRQTTDSVAKKLP